MSKIIKSPVNAVNPVVHGTFRIERAYPQPPAVVFSAFADKAKVRRWRRGRGRLQSTRIYV